MLETFAADVIIYEGSFLKFGNKTDQQTRISSRSVIISSRRRAFLVASITVMRYDARLRAQFMVMRGRTESLIVPRDVR